MAWCDDIDGMPTALRATPLALPYLRRSISRAKCVRLLLGLFVAVILTGCGSNYGAGSLIVDPGHYNAYHCNDLDARAKALSSREKELRALMDKASEGGGGVLIGTLAYRTDYESVLTEEKLVQREQAEKKCQQPTTNFQSDQTIR